MILAQTNAMGGVAEMHNTGWLLIFKFAISFMSGLLTLALFDDNTWYAVLGWSLAAAIINVLIGELILRPSTGNTIVSVADGVLGAISAWVFGALFTWFRTTGATLVALAALIAIIEYFFQPALLKVQTEPQ